MKHTLKTLTLTIALLVGSVSVSYSEENNITKLSCLFEGQGFQTLEGKSPTNYDVKIEQTLDFNNTEVTNHIFYFISDNNFLEHLTITDGKKFGWLEFETLITENHIIYRSQLIGNDPLKSRNKNLKHIYYYMNLRINRNTGFGTRKMEYHHSSFSKDWISEYIVSGDCKVVTKKF